ncbi:hypothetical protein FOZ60_004496 [Perkinsus olseni]|uniref:Uncharacterized protein n=1 Tax=Perkinsus olseni TaxID=32597 RepID=A0A7J6PPQ3_PEROL|nr:hypothetical protein FOZ60_004496 [Perkinsus olseni]
MIQTSSLYTLMSKRLTHKAFTICEFAYAITGKLLPIAKPPSPVEHRSIAAPLRTPPEFRTTPSTNDPHSEIADFGCEGGLREPQSSIRARLAFSMLNMSMPKPGLLGKPTTLGSSAVDVTEATTVFALHDPGGKLMSLTMFVKSEDGIHLEELNAVGNVFRANQVSFSELREGHARSTARIRDEKIMDILSGISVKELKVRTNTEDIKYCQIEISPRDAQRGDGPPAR